MSKGRQEGHITEIVVKIVVERCLKAPTPDEPENTYEHGRKLCGCEVFGLPIPFYNGFPQERFVFGKSNIAADPQEPDADLSWVVRVRKQSGKGAEVTSNIPPTLSEIPGHDNVADHGNTGGSRADPLKGEQRAIWKQQYLPIAIFLGDQVPRLAVILPLVNPRLAGVSP